MEWVDFISNVGFPIAMVLYFAFRMEKIIKEHTSAIIELKLAIIQMKGGKNE